MVTHWLWTYSSLALLWHTQIVVGINITWVTMAMLIRSWNNHTKQITEFYWLWCQSIRHRGALYQSTWSNVTELVKSSHSFFLWKQYLSAALQGKVEQPKYGLHCCYEHLWEYDHNLRPSASHDIIISDINTTIAFSPFAGDTKDLHVKTHAMM